MNGIYEKQCQWNISIVQYHTYTTYTYKVFKQCHLHTSWTAMESTHQSICTYKKVLNDRLPVNLGGAELELKGVPVSDFLTGLSWVTAVYE